MKYWSILCIIFLASCSQERKITVPMDWENSFTSLYTKTQKGATPDEWARLGWYFEEGYGVQKDRARAFQCFQRAAQGGNREGILAVIGRLESGHVVQRNVPAAMEWRKKIVAIGRQDDVQENCEQLGKYYFKRGNYAESLNWFKRGASANSFECCKYTARQYEYGLGIAKNPATAMQYAHRMLTIAKHDRTYYEEQEACMLLGHMYEYGALGKVDLVSSLAWYEQGILYGNKTPDPKFNNKGFRVAIKRVKQAMQSNAQ